MYAYIHQVSKQRIKNKPSMYVQEYPRQNKQKIFRQKKIIVSKKNVLLQIISQGVIHNACEIRGRRGGPVKCILVYMGEVQL